MLLDDECQAIADLDVIFENERLDAILGSSNTMPVETDRPLQQMLGLDNLEDLPTMSQGEADFQRAMMEGCGPNAICIPIIPCMIHRFLLNHTGVLHPARLIQYPCNVPNGCGFWNGILGSSV